MSISCNFSLYFSGGTYNNIYKPHFPGYSVADEFSVYTILEIKKRNKNETFIR